MKKIYDLNDDNYMMIAIKHYDNPLVIQTEFDEDYKRIKYIKRLISRYKNSGKLKTRLLLNHIIILGNVFGSDFTSRILFYEIPKKDHNLIKTFLIYLGYVDSGTVVQYIRGKELYVASINIEQTVVNDLRNI